MPQPRARVALGARAGTLWAGWQSSWLSLGLLLHLVGVDGVAGEHSSSPAFFASCFDGGSEAGEC